jgi:flagellar capping protein FliD
MKTKFTQRIDDIDNDLDRLIENIKSQFKSMSGDMKIL